MYRLQFGIALLEKFTSRRNRRTRTHIHKHNQLPDAAEIKRFQQERLASRFFSLARSNPSLLFIFDAHVNSSTVNSEQLCCLSSGRKKKVKAQQKKKETHNALLIHNKQTQIK
jgi:hypothetical protein